MEQALKQRILAYIAAHDPNGELITTVEPGPDFLGGTIEYNRNAVTLHRAITELGDEEYVRAYLFVRLVRELGYTPSPEVFEFEREYGIGRQFPERQRARADVILRYPSDYENEEDRGRAFLFIECKTPATFETDKRYIEGQVFDLSKQEEVRPVLGVYYTVTENQDAVLDRPLIITFADFPEFSAWDAAGQPARDVFPARYGRPTRIVYAHVGAATQLQRPLRTTVTSAELERIRGDIHNIVWAGGGANNNDVFVTLLRLMLCRIYDELETRGGQAYTFQRKELPDGSLEGAERLVERMSELFLLAARNYLGYSQAELDETIPFERRKVEPQRIAYVVEQLQGISLTQNTSNADIDLLGNFFEQIVSQDFTQSKGQFFTHKNVVNFCLELASVGARVRETFLTEADEQGRPRLPYIIDPSAGSGTFLVEAMREGTNHLQPLLADGGLNQRQRQFAMVSFGPESPNQWAREYIYGIEPNTDLGLACKVNMILHGDGSTNVFIRSGLLPFIRYGTEGRNHVLSSSIPSDRADYSKNLNERFDIVLTNPPFSLTLSEDEGRQLQPVFDLSVASNSETLFIERWFQLLREGGITVAVLPESVFDTPSALGLRLFLFSKFEVDAVISLPYVSFKPFTSTKTCVVLLRKRRREEAENWTQIYEDRLRHYERAPEDAANARLGGISTPALASRYAFEQTVTELEQDRVIFMAEPEEVGYKRRKGLPDLPRPNDLIGPDEASVVGSFRAGAGQRSSQRYGFWVTMRDVARNVGLRLDPKYHALWTLNQGRVFSGNEGPETTLGSLISPLEREKVRKGPLPAERELIELEDVEPRTSKLLNVQTVDNVGSEKIEFGAADIAISKLEPYLGKVLTQASLVGRMGSTEWLTYALRDGVDLDYVRYLLCHPEMLAAFRCLQSGKRHARLTEFDLLNLVIPELPPEAQRELADTARDFQQQVNDHERLARQARASIGQAYTDRFQAAAV